MKRRTLLTAVALLSATPLAVLAWTGPTGAPPNNNTSGPVWLQTGAVTAQTGKISISGATINAATTTQDLYVTSGKSVRADGSGATTFNFGNYGGGASGFTMGVYGNLNVAGFGGSNGTLTATQICLTGDVCRTTWPTGGGAYPGDIFVNTTGDAMTGALTISTPLSGISQALDVTITSGAAGNRAIRGTATAVAGATAVQGDAGATGIGVAGTAVTGGTGVYGSTVTGRGVDARATGAGDALFAYNNSTGLAGRFASDNGTALIGTTAISAGRGAIFYNNGASNNAIAVVGQANNCVNGASNCGAIGVQGIAANGMGVRGDATNQLAAGVYGFGFYGLQGSGLTGVRGDATSAFGVEGYGPVAGVYGSSTLASSRGVYGTNDNASGMGVYGRNRGPSGYGVMGQSSGSGGYGVYGTHTGGGTAGAFGSGSIGVASTGTGVGVIGEGTDVGGVGIQGFAGGSVFGGTQGVGVRGTVRSGPGVAVQGIVPVGGDNRAFAGWFEAYNPSGAANGKAIYAATVGNAGTTDGGGISIYSKSMASGGVGVLGEGGTSGVVGTTYGLGTNPAGVTGNSTVSTGFSFYGTGGKLWQQGGTDASLSNGSGFLLLGTEGGTNIVMDDNEITARSNGVASPLYLNYDGGGVSICRNVNCQLSINTTANAFAIQLPNTATDNIGRGQANSWSTGSDGRFKFNRKSIEYGLDQVMKLEPLSYDLRGGYVKDGKPVFDGSSDRMLGFIAQDVEKIIPEAANKPSDPANQFWSLDYDRFAPVLVKAVQELKSENDSLKSQLDSLTKRLEKLEAAQ
jgi:hypothetical protein